MPGGCLKRQPLFCKNLLINEHSYVKIELDETHKFLE